MPFLALRYQVLVSELNINYRMLPVDMVTDQPVFQSVNMVSSTLILSVSTLLLAKSAASAVIQKRDCGFVWPASAGDTCKSLASDWVCLNDYMSVCIISSLIEDLTGYHRD